MKYSSAAKTILSKIDKKVIFKYLPSLAVTFLLSLFIKAVFAGLYNTRGIFWSLITAVILIWHYKSIRKYGFLNTMGFTVFFPFIILSYLAAAADKAGNNTNHQQTSPSYSQSIKEKIENMINENHACKFDRLEEQNDGFYIYFKIPFGIYPPYDRILRKISEELRVPKEEIGFNEITPTHIYFYFPKNALKEYMRIKNTDDQWTDPKKFWDRIILRTPVNPK